MRLRAIAIALALLNLAACAHVEPSASQADVRRFVDRFIRTVNEADVDGFVACFAPNATAFFPSAANAARKAGAAEIRAAVTPTFSRGRPASPVEPRDLEITIDGLTALVTFVAGWNNDVARRTLVLTRASGDWQIVHLHASNSSR